MDASNDVADASIGAGDRDANETALSRVEEGRTNHRTNRKNALRPSIRKLNHGVRDDDERRVREQ